MEPFGALDNTEKVMSQKQGKQWHVLGWSHRGREGPGRVTEGEALWRLQERQQKALVGEEPFLSTDASWAGQSLDPSSWNFGQEAHPQNASASFVVMVASLEKGESHVDRNSQILNEVMRTETEDCYCGHWERTEGSPWQKRLERKGSEERWTTRRDSHGRLFQPWLPTSSPSQVYFKSICITASALLPQAPKQAQTLPVPEPSEVLVKNADLRASGQTFQSRVASAGDQESSF